MIPEGIQRLIHKYKEGDISETELSELFHWYNQRAKEPVSIDEADMQLRLERIARQLPTSPPKVGVMRSWHKWVAAAAVLFVAGLSLYRYQQQPTEILEAVYADSTASPQFITTNKQQISLNNITAGDTIITDGLRLYKTEDGYVSYSFTEGPDGGNDMHTVKTPVGAESRILLPDGTKVWLNAASELTFPKQFGKNNRKVVLRGEAFFEVSKQYLGEQGFATFQVRSEKQIVEVLGTRFQIKNYEEETVTSTSLYEGSIKLQTLDEMEVVDKAVILKPGQQGLFDRKKNVLDFKNISESEPQTWRDGYFSFHGESLTEVCQQLSRWYPVRFDIPDSLPKGEYHGDIPKTYTLNEVLNILIQDKMKYRVFNKNNQIVVQLTQ